MRWWHRAGVHVRSTIAATGVLAVLMLAASAVLVVLLQRSLVQGIDSTLSVRATGIAAQVELTADGTQSGGTDLARLMTSESARRSWVQVVGTDGRVVAASTDISARVPVTGMPQPAGRTAYADLTVPFDDDPYRVVARGGTNGGHAFTVYVGQSLGLVEASTATVLTLLVVGVPLLLIVLGAATFVFARRSLRPVEAIRRTVASITDRDLSERVDVPPADDEVSRLARTMNGMLERLETAQRSQRRFVADASHELRSPIATLATSAEIQLHHPESGDPAEFPAAVLEESRRLQRLVEDLLLLARADERGLDRSTVRDVDLDDIVDAERHRVAATSRLTVGVHLSPARARGDAHQFGQVLRNLVDNAVQHARTRVEFAVRTQDGRAVVEVFDDGPGIPVTDRERIFERFVRLEESRARSSGGTGLGLAIVRELVTANGGTVRVVDDAAGARFRVEFLSAEGRTGLS